MINRFITRWPAARSRSPSRWWITWRSRRRPLRHPPRPGRDVPLPLTPPVDSSSKGSTGVIHDDVVDEAYLTQIGRRRLAHFHAPENLQKLKEGYQEAAVFLTQKRRPGGGHSEISRGAQVLPHDQVLTLAPAICFGNRNTIWKPSTLLFPEADRYPQSPDFRVLLGSAYYGMENLDQAIAEWEQALAVHDSSQLREA